VFAAYASQTGYSLVDKRLFIPEKWFGDDFESRRKKCKLPAEAIFKTKPQLAVEMLNNLADEGILPFKYILADFFYGVSPEFIDTNRKPISLSTLAKNTNSYFWYRRKVSEGTKGPIVYEFTRRRVKLSGEGIPQREVWVVIRRSIGKNPEYSYYISNASSGMRWAIEQCFEETKSERGMDQYEARKFQGWHHHIITCMLGHFFLWHLKIRFGKKSSIYYAGPAEVLVSSPSTDKGE